MDIPAAYSAFAFLAQGGGNTIIYCLSYSLHLQYLFFLNTSQPFKHLLHYINSHQGFNIIPDNKSFNRDAIQERCAPFYTPTKIIW